MNNAKMKVLIRKILKLLCFLPFVPILITVAYGQAATTHTWLFIGAWFSVRYPAAFHVSPSQRSTTRAGYDSTFSSHPTETFSFMSSHHSGTDKPAIIGWIVIPKF